MLGAKLVLTDYANCKSSTKLRSDVLNWSASSHKWHAGRSRNIQERIPLTGIGMSEWSVNNRSNRGLIAGIHQSLGGLIHLPCGGPADLHASPVGFFLQPVEHFPESIAKQRLKIFFTRAMSI